MSNSPRCHTVGDAPAYPVHKSTGLDSPLRLCGGLTKRELFAAMAMQGWMASFAGLDAAPKAQLTAQEAVKFADALLTELAKATVTDEAKS